ncbi:hypothetical protein L2719_13795 [Shewanella schlegeliana]|uniref:Uncharacterized protein n=1 Tax=Shewanella schlegeliana TaxID=190308 RepID=A0ABS1T2E7_9GAMM|nr:hypothetical protein [Shewanella schlegeliana]MBL4914967.1 hypothetical protein [Shewanella schlegeliana]MCL1110621.1 hypothetical protein [Shewanella schlegeliana]GIU37906.1 hypothetical protein TUM4433_38830 [Shewanella schlegeliana]
MNICKRFQCEACTILIDCRIGMSNRDIQPFQFACPKCEEIISFTIGTLEDDLTGAVDILDFKGPFNGENPFVELHLDFPVSFGEYAQVTTFMRITHEIGQEAFHDLNYRLTLLNNLYSKKRDLQRLITQYKRGDVDAFERACKKLDGVTLESHKKQDVLAALYSATSNMSSPFTIYEQNKEMSTEMPEILRWLYVHHQIKTKEFFNKVIGNDFIRTLHHDCLSLYPKILGLELPFRPTFYQDYAKVDDTSKTPARISTADFDTCCNFYKDLAEVYARQLTLVAGLNNLIKRGAYDLFDDSIRFNKKQEKIKAFDSIDNYANIDLGRKASAIDDSFFRFDESAIDNKIRNGIAHYKYTYKESSQLITFYPAREGMERNTFHELYFSDFMRKSLLLFRDVHNLNHMIKSVLFFNILILKNDG